MLTILPSICRKSDFISRDCTELRGASCGSWPALGGTFSIGSGLVPHLPLLASQPGVAGRIGPLSQIEIAEPSYG